MIPAHAAYGRVRFKPISPLLRTEMTSGRARQRRYTSTPTQPRINGFFRLMRWRRCLRPDALKDGQSWFYLRLQTPIGVKPYKARSLIFTKVRHLSRQNTGSTAQRWSYGNVRYRLVEGNYPEWLAGQSLLDIALNREGLSMTILEQLCQ
jgi:hypothetical protein